ncbi:hypothetical protein Prum_018330 [Phytohabitans rumicis]|uniref:Uncharacterized protein n=1 Tax=Phytohabitans rumicis TaxID=1076125 RepID=A0A6V8L0B0_9ACTN|nr:hypothetical protein Prum_018330 [Phytohabitans rumicis]
MAFVTHLAEELGEQCPHVALAAGQRVDGHPGDAGHPVEGASYVLAHRDPGYRRERGAAVLHDESPVAFVEWQVVAERLAVRG